MQKERSILKLKPSCKDYLWGGHRLVEEYGKEYDKAVLAESWELSCHPDGPSVIENGIYAGKTLRQYIDEEGREVLGRNCRSFCDFPILIKLIDAKDKLSIQVHPDNAYALKKEGQYGKTEMWYVMDAGENAFLYYGFQREISREELERRIYDETLTEVLNAVPVQKGDVFFIEAGTIHAIGGDILIAEIQQNSNVTYRVYDYGRTGKDGKTRELHIKEALEVTNRKPSVKNSRCLPHVAACDYFTVDKLNLDGELIKRVEGRVLEESFASILVLEGAGAISSQGEVLTFKKGDSLFIPAGSGDYTIEGCCEALVTTIPGKKEGIRIGIDIGGTDTKIGLIDKQNKIIARETIKTNGGRTPEEIVREIGEKTLELLEREEIGIEECSGVGVGVPGTLDCKNGVVIYSNNIKWENVAIVRELERYLPIPVSIANDADCAALGEAAAGAGKRYQDVIMLTLGTGVGGGVILDGRVYQGKGIGGCELGHMVIIEDGELCTCGRRGCLEAYCSATALIRDAKRAVGKDMTPKEIFEAADEAGELKEIVDLYIRRLGVGIANIVNIFRPQIVLLGGGISAQGSVLTKPLCEILKKSCFGGERGDIPEIAIAELGNDAGMIGAANLLD
ncbi:type I phosphomannose isomerase catalytic subunit [Acetivibrio ethanolgignens]|uniref:Phosphohexomutase n=1 Tax=Acetivibrio ethanolgignens TaxID=290052 RepID=A0A0V8QJ37_9FIRM|nr:mannose-6-phosphate isomerase [Acetivibrio ethanolgignens]